MFDAAGVATAAEVAVDNVAQEQAERAFTPENLQAQAVNQENQESEELTTILIDFVPSAGRNEILFEKYYQGRFNERSWLKRAKIKVQ